MFKGLDGHYYKDKRYLKLANRIERYWRIINEKAVPDHIHKACVRHIELYSSKKLSWLRGNVHKMQTRSKSRRIPFVCGSC